MSVCWAHCLQTNNYQTRIHLSMISTIRCTSPSLKKWLVHFGYSVFMSSTHRFTPSDRRPQQALALRVCVRVFRLTSTSTSLLLSSGGSDMG